MKKVYSVIVISILFLLSFSSSLSSLEIDDISKINDLIFFEEDDHCNECEDYDFDGLDSGVFYFDFSNKSIESTLIEIQSEIELNNYSWTAGYNTVFSPNSVYDGIGLGCIIEKSENDYENQPVALIYNESLPDKFTWQDIEGVNWVTPVQNQLSCGSCVAFGTIGALESVIQIELNQQLNIDLSESHLFYCGGGSCSYGWTISKSVSFLETFGVPEEDCFPYTPRQTDCDRTCSDWETQAIKLIDGSRIKYSYPATIAKVQEALIEYGPLVTSFTVYSDFFSYNSGVYYQTSDNVAGGHAVAVVGYDNINEYWICKNSWGKGWGENGFFRIGYGECGIASPFNTFYLSGVYGGICEDYLPLPLDNPFPTDKAVNIDLEVTLAWMGGDPNPEDKVNYELYFGVEEDNLSLISTLGPFSSSDRLISFPIDKLESENIYYWQVIAIDSDNSRRIGPVWRFSTIDLNAPYLEVKTPISGFMYKNNGTFRKQIPDENNIIIFGSISILLNLIDNGSGVEKVEIFIDNKLKDTIIIEPYDWYWNQFSFGKHVLKIIAYDYAGNKAEQTLELTN
jgi:C1A family cysteine protease